MIERTTEQRTYVRTRGMRELRDRLRDTSVRHVAQCCIPGTARKNWRNVLGSTAHLESKDDGNKSLLLTR